MRRNKNLLAVATALTVCLIAVWFSVSIRGAEKSYEIKPIITMPEYRTDTARAIDAYERVMNRFMGLTERNLAGINTEVKGIAKKLDSIDYKLTELFARIARIEKALGIEPFKKPVAEPPKAETLNCTDKPGSENQQ